VNTGTIAPSSASLAFGSVVVGSTSTQNLSLTNTGTEAVNISQATISGTGFSVVGSSPSGSIAAGQGVTVQIQFAPTSTGAASGSFSLVSDASNSTVSISLAGTGAQAGLAVSPSSVSFGSVSVGQSSSQSVNLTNTGSTSVVVNLATVAGSGFGVSGLSLPTTINAGQTLPFTVQFTPASASSVTGSITFTDTAGNSPQTLSLTGTGVSGNASLKANPLNVAFGNIVVGTNGKQTVTLSNTGTTSETITQVSASGTGFSVSGLATPLNLPAGNNTSFTVQFAPTTGGNSSGNITVSATSNDSDPTVVVGVSGTGIQAGLSANPSSINFGSVLVNTSSSVSVTLKNTGTANTTVSAASASGTGFSISGLSTPLTLTAGQTATFTAKYAPTSAGTGSGSVSITSNAPGSPLTIALSGTASNSQAQLTLTTTSVSFGNVNVGSSTSQNITLTNSGNVALTISVASASGTGFTLSGLPVPETLNPGLGTTFAVQFAPTAAGNASGSVSITSNAPNSPATIALSGTGIQAQIGASPSSVAFGNVVTGTNVSQPISISNGGNTTLTISQAIVAGTGFSTTGLTTPLTIQAGKSASFNAVFMPSSTTTVSGSISLSSNAPNSPLQINLTGTGVAATKLLGVSTLSVNFGNVDVQSSSSQSVTLTNTGNSNVLVSSVTVTGTGFSMTGVSGGTTLTPGQNVVLSVKFAPTSTGAVAGSVAIASNATNSPASFSLSGTGVAATPHTVLVSWTASGTSNVTGYNVYRGTSSGTYSKITSSPVPATTYTDATVQSGQNITYYYVVTAVDSNGVESTGSNQATATVP